MPLVLRYPQNGGIDGNLAGPVIGHFSHPAAKYQTSYTRMRSQQADVHQVTLFCWTKTTSRATRNGAGVGKRMFPLGR